jgi:hypothetical protein
MASSKLTVDVALISDTFATLSISTSSCGFERPTYHIAHGSWLSRRSLSACELANELNQIAGLVAQHGIGALIAARREGSCHKVDAARREGSDGGLEGQPYQSG